MIERFNSIHSYGITHFIFMIIKQDLFRKDNFDCCSKLLTLIMTIIILLKDKCKLIEYYHCIVLSTNIIIILYLYIYN